MHNNRELRVLLVEDQEIDAELIVKQLRRAGYAPDWTRVDRESDFVGSLSEKVDVILCDYSMPQFSGLRALTLLQERGLDIPFIIVSGTIGEETAVDAIKRGAVDYLLKDRLTRLGPAVTQALADRRARGEIRKTDDALRIANAQLAQMLEHSPAVLYMFKLVNGEPNPQFVTDNIQALLGFSASEVLSMEWWNAQLHPDDVQCALEGLTETLTLGDSRTEYRLRRKDGTDCWIDDARRLVRNADGEPAELIGVWTDINERKRAEAVLQASEERFHFVARAMSDAVWDWDLVANTFWRNDGYFKLFGIPTDVDAAEVRPWTDRIHPDDRTAIIASIEHAVTTGAESWAADYRIVRTDASHIWVEDRGYILHDSAGKAVRMVGGMRDISRKKSLDAHLLQAQKMAVVGQFSSGIAHDFNNILLAIGGYAEHVRDGLADHSEIRADLDAVITATNRASGLVRQILSFSRQQPEERAALLLSPVVTETLKLLRATIPSNITFNVMVADEIPMVLANAGQVHQVLMNLGVNAWHAMKGRSGQLYVAVEKFSVDVAYAAANLRLRPGNYVRVSVGDTGTGMNEAVLQQIFEPFFTTKAPGEGTGLGLAAVHGIMASHDGAVTVYSQPGEGTMFRLYFPVHMGELTAPSGGMVPTPRGNGERILVVDDEAVLGRLCQKVLGRLGYNAEATSDPRAALELVRAEPSRFVLVLTDQTMPEMSGLVLAAELQAVRPGIPILLMTGDNRSVTAEHTAAAGVHSVILKPMSMHDLGMAVHHCLGGR